MAVKEYHQRLRDEKRSAALQAAVRSFLKHGYDSTTLLQVARAAGISTGTLFKHFPTKAELFAAIMEDLWQVDPALARPLPPPGDPRRGLLASGHGYARLLREPHTEPLFRVIIAEAPRFPELSQSLFDRGIVPYLSRLHAYLASEINEGTLRIPDVPLAARQFFGMINNVIFWPRFLQTKPPVSDQEVEYVVGEAAMVFLAHYATPRGSPFGG